MMLIFVLAAVSTSQSAASYTYYRDSCSVIERDSSALHSGIALDVCNTIARADSRLNVVYKNRMRAFTTKRQKDSLRRDEILWISGKRSRCGLSNSEIVLNAASADCLLRETRKRIGVLASLAK